MKNYSKPLRLASQNFKDNGYSDNWGKNKKLCMEESNYRCACGNKAVEVHHVIPVSKGGSNALSNLVALCKTCHIKHHKHLFNKLET